MNRRLLRACGVALLSFSLDMVHAPVHAVQASGCGFYKVEPNVGSLTARYKHCGSGHIMIKWHWSNGSTSSDCVEPWGEYSFHRFHGHVVVNAYYMPVRPNVFVNSDGRRVCNPSIQPDV